MNSIQSVGNSYGDIASGKRINKAADDAAGLAISQKMQKEERGQEQGAENIRLSVDTLNVADGAMSKITEYLQRIKELSTKASNSTVAKEDKQAIQDEVSQMMKGIQETAVNTQFNTQKLLDGSFASMNVASNPDGTGMSIQMQNTTLSSLGIEGYDVTKDFDMGRIDQALQKVTSARSSAGASQNALEYAYNSNLNTAENTLASRSRIEDLDVAKAVTEKKKNEVLDDYKILMQKKQSQDESMVTKLFQ